MEDFKALSINELRGRFNQLRAEAVKDRISALVAVYGSVRAVGRALRIDHAYLHRLANGKKTNPSSSILRKLGLDADD